MNMNNENSGFEKLLKDKLSNFEYSYNHKDWQEFEKRLPKSPNSFTSPKNLWRLAVITAAVFVPLLAVLYFNSGHGKKNGDNNVAITHNKINIHANSVDGNRTKDNITINQNLNNSLKENKSDLTSANGSPINDLKESGENTKEKIYNNNSTSDNSTKTKRVDNTKAVSNQNTNIYTIPDYIAADIKEGCVPLKVQFTPLIISDTISYQWAFGDNKASTKKSPQHIYTKPGLFTVSLTVKFKKSGIVKKITYPLPIEVKATPIAKFSFTVDKETDIFTFTDNSLNASVWSWSLGDRTSSTEQNPQHEYISDGLYNVQLIAYNNEGCSDTSVIKVTVKNKEPFYLPTAYKPDDVNNSYFGPIGAKMSPDGYKFSIFSREGRLVFESTSLDKKWDGKIQGTNTDAPAGIYVCKITMKNKHGNLQDYNHWVTLFR